MDLSVDEKIQLAFELPEVEPYRGEYSCWLVKSLLIKGNMFLTDGHLCFYASLPREKGLLEKSGFLHKKVNATNQYATYWFVLKDDALNFYENSQDLYYPIGGINLKSVIAVEKCHKPLNSFRLLTHKAKYRLRADTEASMHEWMKLIKASMFRARNEGDDVKIVLPWSIVTSMEIARNPVGLDTMQFKVVDPETHVADEVRFSLFSNLHTSDFSSCSITLHSWRTLEKHQFQKLDVSAYKHLSRKRSLYDSTKALNLSNVAGVAGKRSTTDLLTPPEGGQPVATAIECQTSLPQLTGSTDLNSHRRAVTDNLYESGQSFEEERDTLGNDSSLKRTSGWGWVASARAIGHRKTISEGQGFGEGIASHESSEHPRAKPPLLVSQSSVTFASDVPTSAWEAEKRDLVRTKEESKAIELHDSFNLPDSERLILSHTCYLIRVIPRVGRAYITDRYLCFKSHIVGVRAKVIIPIQDIREIHKDRRGRSGVTFSYHGLYVLTRDQYEFTFDFHSAESRNKFFDTLKIGKQPGSRRSSRPSSRSRIDPTKILASVQQASASSLSPSVTDSAGVPSRSESSAVMIDSTPFGFVEHPDTNAPPPQPLRITCLTIGSRGDVQPYIALCKRLMQSGHHCRIATHLEFKGWIESHGIEFREVGGNPEELMRLCVDNGMFTYSFLKEGLGRFRGWLDELLMSAWDACQGSDVLIDSPSTLCGVHIAEALGVAYFQAFTMPWTRTRMQVHMGPGYNYMTHVLIDQVLWTGIAPQILKWRKNVLNRPACGYISPLDQKIPMLYNFSPVTVPPPVDWPDWVHTTGYWFLDNPEINWTAPQTLVDFLEGKPARTPQNYSSSGADQDGAASKKPIVYIGFGSIIVPDPDGMTQIIVEAVKKAGVRAILSKGWSARAKEQAGAADAAISGAELAGEFPDDIYPLDKVPHDWLFPKVAAVVHHGGAGTLSAGMRAGVPTIVKPWFGDQYFWADRMQDLGVGCAVRKLTVDKLAAALIQVTTDDKMKEKARLLGERIRSEDGVGNAVKCIYRDLEFARNQIRKLADANANSAAACVGHENQGSDEAIGDQGPNHSSPPVISRGRVVGRSKSQIVRSTSGSNRSDPSGPSSINDGEAAATPHDKGGSSSQVFNRMKRLVVGVGAATTTNPHHSNGGDSAEGGVEVSSPSKSALDPLGAARLFRSASALVVSPGRRQRLHTGENDGQNEEEQGEGDESGSGNVSDERSRKKDDTKNRGGLKLFSNGRT
ncbi:hypothetical protein BJ742DRAFT_749002 [Cladochytrium replicatum]|nr:hypothetical protein BJ742DRAFT_749002 [Cladochytrium replicatum]